MKPGDIIIFDAVPAVADVISGACCLWWAGLTFSWGGPVR